MLPFFGECQSVNYYLNPQVDNGYLAWYKDAEMENPLNWKIELFQVDSLNNPTNLIFTQTTANNFARIPETLIGGNYAAKVTALYSGNDIGVDIEYICPGCGTILLEEWGCNGPDYAYNVKLVQRIGPKDYYYALSIGRECDANGNCEPYYRYMSPQEYWDWEANVPVPSAYNPVPFVSSGGYVNSQGNAITGLIWRLDKRLEQYNGAPYTTVLLGGGLPAYYNANIHHASNWFNIYKDPLPFQTRPDLVCIPSPTNPAYPGIKHSELEIKVRTKITIDKNYQPLGIGDTIIKSNNVNSNLWDELRRVNDELIDEYGFPTDGNTYFKDIVLTKLNEEVDAISFNPDDIFHENGIVEYPYLSLSNGLYKINVRFLNNEWIDNVFEFEEEPEFNIQATIADSVSMQAFPNPLTDGILNVVLESERDLEVELRILGSNGYIHHSQDMVITEEMGQEFVMDINEFNLQNDSYFFVQLLFSDASVLSKTVILPNY